MTKKELLKILEDVTDDGIIFVTDNRGKMVQANEALLFYDDNKIDTHVVITNA